MRIIVPFAGALSVLTASPTYTYIPWAAAQDYAAGAVVRWRPTTSTSAYYDYRCRFAHTSATSSNPSNTLYWYLVGMSSTTTLIEYDTNVRESAYAKWVSASAVAQGAIKYDIGNHHDYVAPNAITAGDNTIRPSEAVLSTTPAVAARWVDAGASNAWAPFDAAANTYLIGRAGNNSILSSLNFTFETQTAGRSADAVYLSGLSGAASVSAEVLSVIDTEDDDGTPDVWSGFAALDKTITLANIRLGGTYSYGQERNSVVLPFTTGTGTTPAAIPPGYTIKVKVTLAREDAASAMRCSVCGLGTIFDLACTEWGVESSLLDFSKVDRDATYGTVDFIKRGNAARLQATCCIDPLVVSGDVIYSLLRKFTGTPLMLDFNNAPYTTVYDRLMIYGFYTGVRTILSASTLEVLTLEVEGLAQ